ncbi:MAG: DUF3822 family protein [Cytophagales bacterium]
MKDTIQKNHRSTQRIKDEKFNVEDIGSYDLVLYLSSKHFKCSAASEKLGRCVFFESFDFTKTLDQDAILNQLNLIFEEHHVLQAGFWNSVRCVLSEEFFTLVPKELFIEKKASKLLALNFSEFDARSKDTGFFKPNSGPAISVFSIPKKINTFLKKFYPKIKIQYLHELTSTLEGIISWGAGRPKVEFSAYLHNQNITIVCTDKGKIRFFNTFKYDNPEDAIYYLLSVIQEFDIKASQASLSFYGDVVKDSAIIKSAQKYIGEVHLGERPKLFYFNYEFDEIPSQWHFETFCAYLCK